MRLFLKLFFVVILFSVVKIEAAPPAGYGLLWSDEFDKPTIDTAVWTFDTGVGNPDGWGNAEAEYYTNGSNFTVENGVGVLWAKHESKGNKSYTSCRMKTKAKKEFKYGYFEAKIKTPKGRGLWPAFWTLGSDIDVATWPSCGEVELYEQRTGPQTYPDAKGVQYPGDNLFVQTCHYSSVYGQVSPVYNTNPTGYSNCLCDSFHLYAIEWDSTKITYYFDGKQSWQYTNINLASNKKSFHQPHFFIANIAVGGNYQGNNIDNTIFPQKMSIDYVRVYQKGIITQASPAEKKNISFSSLVVVNPEKAQLKLFDVTGRLVGDFSNRIHLLKNGDSASKSVPNGIAPGSYILHFYDGKNVSITQKMIVSR